MRTAHESTWIEPNSTAGIDRANPVPTAGTSPAAAALVVQRGPGWILVPAPAATLQSQHPPAKGKGASCIVCHYLSLCVITFHCVSLPVIVCQYLCGKVHVRLRGKVVVNQGDVAGMVVLA